MKTTLLIMAAGIGSRFGEGIKQLTLVGPNGEIIMDYSIHDAIKAGFNKIVFVIRKDIEEDFKEIIGKRIEAICSKANVEVVYVFQSLDNLPKGYTVPHGRTKPWGTGQAVLAAKDLINEPFAIINADDYYGKEPFYVMYNYLVSKVTGYKFCMVGFQVQNTLSDNGAVTRGVCQVDQNGYLAKIVETSGIEKTETGAKAGDLLLDKETPVSMNMFGFSAQYMDILQRDFSKFLDNISDNPLKAEYLIPIHIGQLLENREIEVKVLPTKDQWFGVTYKEDKDIVVNSLKNLIANGTYRLDLFSDLDENQ